MSETVSIIVPVYNASRYLPRCLGAISRLNPRPIECIVVDDGSTDDSHEIAERAGFRVLRSERRRGPAVARNLGAAAARGDILLFVDADVVVSPECVGRLADGFAADPSCDAVIGSYDDQPGSPDFVSQYRNLLHAFMHQGGRRDTCLFWTGCGAIRVPVFREHGGFSESIGRPCMEDVELGLRLREAGRTIRLDKGLLVKHLKHLTLREVLKMDLLDRALPWSRLILRFHSMPSDLNLRWSQRFSVLAAFVGVAMLPVLMLCGVPAAGCIAAAVAPAMLLAMLNRGFYRFLANRRGLWFAARAFPLHCLYFLCSGLGFAVALLQHALHTERPTPTVACRPRHYAEID